MLRYELQRRTIAKALKEPEAIVVVDKLRDDGPCFFDGFKAVEIKHLFLQRSIEALDDTIAFGTAHERWRVGHSQELELVLEVV